MRGHRPEFSVEARKKVDVDVRVKVDIDKDVYSSVYLTGNLAEAEANADAFGGYYGTLSETLTFATATDHSSQSFSSSIAAVD